MSEHDLWIKLRGALGTRGHWTRIEYNVVPGIPDTSYCLNGCEGFLELKFAKQRPARATTPVFGVKGLRDDQVTWIYNRTKHGGRVYILAQVGSNLSLLHGRYCRVFNAMTMHELQKHSLIDIKLPMVDEDIHELYTELRR